MTLVQAKAATPTARKEETSCKEETRDASLMRRMNRDDAMEPGLGWKLDGFVFVGRRGAFEPGLSALFRQVSTYVSCKSL